MSAAALNPSIKPEDLQRIEENLGLGRPLHEQYLRWLADLARGDLGRSLVTGSSVTDVIVVRVPNTLLLTGLAFLFEYLLAVPIGVIAALHHRRLIDQIANLYAAVGVAIPGFWLGILLIFTFAIQFQAWGLPHLPVAPTIIVWATLALGNVILVEASLSYLGLGVPPPTPSWGSMLTNAQQYFFRAPTLVFAPGIAIFLTVLSATIVGNALRDALDPRLAE